MEGIFYSGGGSETWRKTLTTGAWKSDRNSWWPRGCDILRNLGGTVKKSPIASTLRYFNSRGDGTLYGRRMAPVDTPKATDLKIGLLLFTLVKAWWPFCFWAIFSSKIFTTFTPLNFLNSFSLVQKTFQLSRSPLFLPMPEISCNPNSYFPSL